MPLGAGGSPGWAHHNYLNCQVHGKDLCGGWNIEARCCFCELRDHDLLSGDVFLKNGNGAFGMQHRGFNSWCCACVSIAANTNKAFSTPGKPLRGAGRTGRAP